VPDPEQLLQGQGKQDRFLCLPDADVLRRPAVQALICSATTLGPPLVPGPGGTVVGSISARQRPRRSGGVEWKTSRSTVGQEQAAPDDALRYAGCWREKE